MMANLIKLKSTKDNTRPVVLNLGSIEPQGFVESVSGAQHRSRILRLFSTLPFLEIHVLLVLFFEHSDFVSN